ncbi:hypothetical protein T484DRAFT_2696272 [Baffinella frigidus]|nr:hypothetical protein T484DRAFT_2696272 [Cryptophyta sp. CCMP2293]
MANLAKRVHRALDGNFDEYNISAPLLTSPRSVEACLRQGIDAEELVFRYEDSFFEKAVTPDVQEIRWKHYETKRLEKLSMVREERQTLVTMGWKPMTPRSKTAASGSAARSDAHSEGGGDHQTSQAALKEQRAMESIKLRRQQELEQMVAYELKLTETAAEQQRNQEIERRKQLAAQKERQKRQKVWEEMQRHKEVEKAKQQARQERLRKKLAAEEFAKEQLRESPTPPALRGGPNRGWSVRQFLGRHLRKRVCHPRKWLRLVVDLVRVRTQSPLECPL